MKVLRVLGFIFLICLGVFVFFFGGYDDSPGAQLLGVLLVAGTLTGWFYRSRN